MARFWRGHRVQRDVAEFHRKVCGVEQEYVPEIRRPELRARLIAEEARETLEAITGRKVTIEIGPDQYVMGPDLLAAIDGMCDLLCVIYGTAEEFGVDLAPFWEEVHRSNMAKEGGPVREDGKRLKPLGWTPPALDVILARLVRSPRTRLEA